MDGGLMPRILTALIVALLTIAFPAFADLHDEFEALRESGKDFQIVGTVCEEVARLDMLRHYYPDDKYDVITGIAYGNGSRTIGEIDVVVFDESNRKVVHVAEVKCWRNMSRGLRKARDQRQRLQRALASGKQLQFISTSDRTMKFEQEQFHDIREYSAIAQKGAMNVGYEDELDYSLDELMELRRRMIQCQQRGECLRPD
jgi:hypothetical protein